MDASPLWNKEEERRRGALDGHLNHYYYSLGKAWLFNSDSFFWLEVSKSEPEGSVAT